MPNPLSPGFCCDDCHSRVLEVRLQDCNLVNEEDTHKKPKMNPFMNFSNQHRQEVREKHPDLRMTEIAKILGSMWRALSETEKDKYR
jgi:hypothetical protein